MAAVNNNAPDKNQQDSGVSIVARSTIGNSANGNAVPGNTPAASGVGTPTQQETYVTPGSQLTEEETAYYDHLYTHGGWTQDLQESISHGGTTDPQKYFDGSDGWYFYDRGERTSYSGDADATFMSGADYERTTRNKNEWHRLDKLKKEAAAAGNMELVAQLQAQQDACHADNERIRAGYGYSGGENGSMYYVLDTGKSNNIDERQYRVEGIGSSSSTGAGSSGAGGGESDLSALLQAWQQAAMNQSDGKVDYAVAKAVADLERALADAQPQFKEQAESVDRDAMQAMDNSALYAEMRGDKGGIGQEQYNSIQNTRAQNHLTVQQAQTKLATDTQRQIADLRAQGEFEKADAALQITQQYLQQLVSLEQWAAEYNLSVEQFNASLAQWEAEYNLAMQQFETSKQQWAAEFGFQQQQYQNSLNQWQAEFDAAQSQWQQQFDYGKQSDMANIGWALLEAGVPLSQEQMDAMGIDANQASQILMQQQLSAALKGSDTKDAHDVKMTLTTAKELAKNGIFSEQVLEVLRKNGYDDEALSKIYGYVPQTGQPTEAQTTANYDTLKGHVNAWPSRGITISNIAYMIESALRTGSITETQAEELLNLIEQKVG